MDIQVGRARVGVRVKVGVSVKVSARVSVRVEDIQAVLDTLARPRHLLNGLRVCAHIRNLILTLNLTRMRTYVNPNPNPNICAHIRTVTLTLMCMRTHVNPNIYAHTLEP